jgi:hypothetical protein
MTVQLSNDDVQILRDMLHDYLPGLKFEVARTDAPEIRHALVKRQTLCERLIGELDGGGEQALEHPQQPWPQW